jgi:hypothetical protein
MIEMKIKEEYLPFPTCMKKLKVEDEKTLKELLDSIWMS